MLEGWPLPCLYNEAESGSFTCGSRLRLTRLRTPDHSDARSLGYMSNGQFTWQAPFSLQDLPDFAWRTNILAWFKTGSFRVSRRCILGVFAYFPRVPGKE